MKEIEIQGIKIQYDDNNVRIVDSLKIKDRLDMIVILLSFKAHTHYKSKRSLTSWLKEWKAHNRLYRLGLFRSHTVDCDLEENERWYRLLAYQILGI